MLKLNVKLLLKSPPPNCPLRIYRQPIAIYARPWVTEPKDAPRPPSRESGRIDPSLSPSLAASDIILSKTFPHTRFQIISLCIQYTSDSESGQRDKDEDVHITCIAAKAANFR